MGNRTQRAVMVVEFWEQSIMKALPSIGQEAINFPTAVSVSARRRNGRASARTRPAVCTSYPATTQITPNELLEVGDLLLDALRLECEFATFDTNRASAKELAEFRMCRRAVEQLAEDYIGLLK